MPEYTNKERERLLEQAADARLVHLNANTIFPLIESRIEAKLVVLSDLFKEKGEIRPADVAYIVAMRDIRLELDMIAKKGDRSAERLNLNPEM